MAGVGPQDLHALAEELLAACEDALNTIPDFAPELGGSPARSFVAPGLPAADCCPQLTVHVVSIVEASTLVEGRSASYGRTNQVTLGITLFRCVDMERVPPLQTELETAAEQVNADGWAIWNHCYNLVRAEMLFAKCLSVVWEGMRTLSPEGGCAGWYGSVRVTLDGYEETLSS